METTIYVRDLTSTVAATRLKGQEVASHIERLGNEGPIVVNFSGIVVASPPFMQEIVRAVRNIGDGATYEDLNNDVADTLDFVESRLG